METPAVFVHTFWSATTGIGTMMRFLEFCQEYQRVPCSWSNADKLYPFNGDVKRGLFRFRRGWITVRHYFPHLKTELKSKPGLGLIRRDQIRTPDALIGDRTLIESSTLYQLNFPTHQINFMKLTAIRKGLHLEVTPI
ncbi:hypothetical protein RRG08_019586 [Elysia crispata]|uniref:Uncharacterized protein n=1 Tax=Elysia crispata TaxID=231223 RepID=A0AAE1ED56_9GAST|nr:hypothetical protein RRG08_019586 [Elysia crispata]